LENAHGIALRHGRHQFFCQQIFHRGEIQSLVCHDALQPGVFLFQCLQPPGIGHLRAAVLLSPGIESRMADTVAAANVARLRASFLFL